MAAEAWYVVAIIDTVVTQAPPSVLLPGLDPGRTYLLSVETPAGDVHASDRGTTWLDGEPVEVSGAVLANDWESGSRCWHRRRRWC